MPKQKSQSIHPIASVASEILLALVRQPDALQIRDRLIGTILAIEIEADPNDRPKLIGRDGKHIAAFTRLLKAMGALRGIEVVVDLIVPPQPPRHVPQPQFEPNPKWHPNLMRPLLYEVCEQLLFKGWQIGEHELKNMTIFQLNCPRHILAADVLASLDILFEAIGYRQGRVVHIAGPDTLVTK